MIKAVFNIEAPRHHVFSVLTDFINYKEWLPGCSVSKIVSSSESKVDTEFTIKSIKTMTMGLRFDINPDQLLSFNMIKGTDLNAYSGSWKLLDSADGVGTVVMGEVEMDAGAMVPKFMVSRMAKKAIEETGQALKVRVQKVPLAEAPQVAESSEEPRTRSRRILHVLRIQDGYRVWLMGESYDLRNR